MLHIIGAVEGYSWERTALWHESIRRHVPEAVVHLVAYGLCDVTRAKYERRGIVVHDGAAAGSHCVVRRFGDWAALVATLSGDVLLTDVRDIVFQEDPRRKLATLLAGSEIVVQTEAQTFRNGHFWCEQNLRQAFPEYAGRLLDYPVICAGMIAGRAPNLSRLCRVVYDLCVSRPDADHPDQAALNVALWSERFHFGARILDPSYSWCYHAALYLHHPDLFRRLGGREPILRDGVCLNADGERYSVLHLCVNGGPWVDAVNLLYAGSATHHAIKASDRYQKSRYQFV